MKKILIPAALLTLVTACANAAPPKGEHPPMSPEHAERMIEHRVERMALKLDLSDAQQTQIKAIYDEQHGKMRKLHDETQTRVDAVLSPEQRERHEQLRQERMEKFKDKFKDKGFGPRHD
ncbi:MAG: Spy/CpxP family protein refolding chaperone [Pseudomonadota bacterium]|nr:Spy/CpxP family protein refolding chaperone [Pseudomonadota bacterium]